MQPEQAAESTYALLQRHRTGDRAALHILIDRYYPRVTRIVRIRLGARLLERETVDDVVQDVFVRIVEGLEGYEPRSDARWIDWVARLAQNEIANHARRDRALKRGGTIAQQVRLHAESGAGFDVPAETTGVSSKASRRELADIVDQCIAGLSESHREVILLRDYAGGDWSSVAAQMGRPSAAACEELHRRARRELGRMLQGRL